MRVEVYHFDRIPTREEIVRIMVKHYGPGEMLNTGFCCEADTEMEHLVVVNLVHDEEVEGGVWVLSFKSDPWER